MSHFRRFAHIVLAISMLLPIALSLTQPGSASAQGGDGTKRQFNAQTGKVSFIGPESGRALSAAKALGISSSIRPADPAIALTKRFAPEFGLKNPERDLNRIKTESLGDGRLTVRYQQNHQGIPVMGGELIVNTNENGDLYSINGEVAADLSLSTQPSIDSQQARQSAHQTIAKWYRKTPEDFVVSEPELWIYDESLLQPSTRPVELVWRMEVTAVDNNLPIHELVLINAQRGNLSLHFNQVDTAWIASGNSGANPAPEVSVTTEGSLAQSVTAIVKTYTAGNGTVLPGTLLCTQTAPGCTNGSNPHADKAHLYAIGTYNMYQSNHIRNSIDNNNMPVISTVNYDSGYANAFWSGEQMVYGDGYGFALADDVVAHELTHGVTQHESNLFYYYQSGAINESFSDLWGEYYDQTNGKGTDTEGAKWQIGEDISGLGAIRSMNNPPAFSNPDKMSSADYSEGEEDNGGVHSNSGLNNKAVFLMVDGGTFNGKTVSALGWTKTAAIYYEVNTNLLSSGADYSDLYYALQKACSNLIGQKGITTGDCTEVKDAVDAVEMNAQPAQNFNTDAPLCSTGTPNITFKDDLENGAASWSFSNGGTTRWQIDSPYYGQYAQSGIHSLYADDYPAAITDVNARLAPFTVPNNAYLHFAHAFGFESFGDPYYFDGGVLEYSLNGGSTWLDAGSLIDFNGYKGTIYNDWNNPLKGRPAFVGSSHGYISTRLNLASLAGKTVTFRWRMGLDDVVSAWGWWVDNVKVYTCADTPNTPTVGPGTYDDAHAAWQYSGGWTTYDGSGPYANTLHYTNATAATATIAFSGTKFKLIFTRHTNRGSFEVWVDDKLAATINASSSSLAWQQTYVSPTYTNGPHTVTIRNVNTPEKYIDIDAIQIYGPLVSVPAGIYDDNDSNWMYSGAWTALSISGPANNTIHYTGSVGDSAELAFNGAGFKLTFTKHTNRGLIDVYVDGSKITTINANAGSLLWQQTYTSPTLTSGNHTVRLVYAGAGTYIDIDAIQIYGPLVSVPAGIYDDNDSNWMYSGAWTTYTSSGPANNTIHYTGSVGDSAEMAFNGAGFKLTFTKHPNRGLIDVYVDGNKITTINANSGSLLWQQTYTSPALTSGNHTVRLVYASAGTYIDIDAIQIYAAAPAGTYDDNDSNWIYSGAWTTYTSSGPANNTLHYTGTISNYAELLFNGTKFTLTFTKHTNRGSIDVYVDGVKITTINANSASLMWQQTYTSPVFSSGNHLVRFVHAGASGAYIDVDAINILP